MFRGGSPSNKTDLRRDGGGGDLGVSIQQPSRRLLLQFSSLEGVWTGSKVEEKSIETISVRGDREMPVWRTSVVIKI